MEVILLERIAKLGQMGDTVRVRDGYARNFLLPQGKALRANEANKKRFDSQLVQLEARSLERKTEADAVAEKLAGQTFVVIRQAGETGQLYGSVTTRDIAESLSESGFSVVRSQVNLTTPIKTIGVHEVAVALHPEVEISVNMNVARSDDEAERQSRGEDLTVQDDDFDFEPGTFDEDDADEDDEVLESADDADEAGDTADEAAAEATDEAGEDDEKSNG